MTFWTDQSSNRLQNLEDKIMRMYLMYILLYLTEGKLEAHRLWLSYLSKLATADMQMLCHIFPILSLQLK